MRKLLLKVRLKVVLKIRVSANLEPFGVRK